MSIGLGVRGRLLLAFFGISAFAVLAAGVAAYSFLEVGDVVSRITQHRVPLALASLELSRHTERVVAAAPVKSAPTVAIVAVTWTGVLLAAIFAVNTITFLAAIQNTKVANALVMLATAPLFAAILSRLFLKEGVRTRTWLAILTAMAGVGLIVWEGLGQGTFLGDALALLAALLLGAKFTIIRSRRRINLVN